MRGEKGYTQNELSEMLNISTRQLQNIEYGATDASLSTIIKLAHVFKTSVERMVCDGEGVAYPSHENLNNLPVGMHVCDTNGLILYINRTFAMTMEYDPLDVCNKMHMWDFLIDDGEKEDFKNYFTYLKEHQPRPTPYVCQKRTMSGRRILSTCHWKYIYDKKDQIIGFVGTVNFSALPDESLSKESSTK